MSLWTELRRRNVLRVGGVYLATAWMFSLCACSSLPPGARPGVLAAGAVVGASILFRVAADNDSSDPPPEVGCFDRIEGGRRDTICPP